MITLLLISALICFGYAAYMQHKYSIASISESYYKTGKNLYFWGWAVSTVFTLLPCWLEVSGENYQFVAFLSSAALLGVGCCPDFNKEHSISHPVFTALCGILAVTWCILAGTWYILFLIPLTIAWCMYRAKWVLTLYYFASAKTLFWLEVASFAAIYISILIKLL